MITNVITTILFLVVSYIFVNYINIYKPYIRLQNFNHENCKIKKEGFIGIQDFVAYKDYLIISTDNILLHDIDRSINNSYNSGITLLNINSNLEEKIDFLNFPQNKTLNSRGIYLLNHNLYVINHNYKLDFISIEEFVIIVSPSHGLIFEYSKSLIFDNKFNLIPNDLVAINENEFFVTIFEPQIKKHPIKKVLSRLYDFSMIDRILSIKLTYVLHCINSSKSNKLDCHKLENSDGYMNNGITYDMNKTILYIADTYGSSIKVYNLTNNYIKYQESLELDFFPEKLEYDSESDMIYSGGYYKISDYIKYIKNLKNNIPLEKITSGSYEIYHNNRSENYEFDTKIVIQQNIISASSALRFRDKIFMASKLEDAIIECKYK